MVSRAGGGGGGGLKGGFGTKGLYWFRPGP
jgi:hypothetical protein